MTDSTSVADVEPQPTIVADVVWTLAPIDGTDYCWAWWQSDDVGGSL